MFYVYILQSQNFPDKFYIGYTARYQPWNVKAYFAINSEDKAKDFENYLKSQSGCEFIKYAPRVNSIYQTDLAEEITDFDKTSNIDTKGHMQYTREQLIQIFSPKQTFFSKNEDQFWFVIISLFTGARRNAATTLQYADIVKKDGIDCIQFKRNHPIKLLKNDESERLVPIAKQLLNLGFVEYINRRKAKFKPWCKFNPNNKSQYLHTGIV